MHSLPSPINDSDKWFRFAFILPSCSTIPIYGHKTFTPDPTFAQSILSSCYCSLWTVLFSQESNATISPGSSILHPTERTNPKWMNDEAQTNETKGTSRKGLFRFLASISSCISGSHSNTAQANYNRLVPAASESQQQLNGVVQRHLPFKNSHRSSSMCQSHCPGNSRNSSVLFHTSSLTVSQIISSGRNGQGWNYTWLRHTHVKAEKLLFEGPSSSFIAEVPIPLYQSS